MLIVSGQRAVLAQAGQLEKGVGTALALLLSFACGSHLPCDVGTGGAVVGAVRERRGFTGDGQVQVDAIKQRAGELVAVALDLVAAASTATGGVAMVAAGAGVHRRHQLEAGREADLVLGPGDHDFARFQGLAQHFQHAPLELRQLIQKQHAMVGQGDLAGLRAAATVGFRNRCESARLEAVKRRSQLLK